MAECSGMVTDITPATRQMKDIIDSLTDLGYEGPLSQEVHLQECITQGLESEEFIHFVTWLSNDISRLLKLEESVSTGLVIYSTFVMTILLVNLAIEGVLVLLFEYWTKVNF